MKKTVIACVALLLATASLAADRNSEHAQKTLEIYRTIIEVDTSKNRNNTEKVANYLAGELVAAGFPREDVEVVPKAPSFALVARYRGALGSSKKPILLLAHMDVVEANAEDWERPPFKLTQDDKYFYARGSVDNKFGAAHLTSTFIRLKKEDFVPNRDLIIVFSGDEESSMSTTRMLANDRPDLAEAEFALNSDAGGGALDSEGRAISYDIQAAEKTYATWEMTARNPGGHSSRPRPDNAIYDLADAIRNIQAYRFPVRWSDMTRNYFRVTGSHLGGELGAAMLRFADDPTDQAATDRLAVESSYVGTTRTTCVVTMLSAGHAENALPQSATATVNCRIFPGTPVSEIESTLKTIVSNETIEFAMLDEPVESPISELREDVTSAVALAVHSRYPDVQIIPIMESGGTDGMHFRRAGIPTWAVSGLFMNPDEMYAHGRNERVPIDGFYDALDHWSIILKALASDR
jgi:acetylornithine deacetylase/succinyl-diaminopimelate desuccinylase-like protein